jgi:alpha-1,2-mannosyltransferase
MRTVWQHLKSGDWLTPERIRVYSLITLGIGTVAALVWIGLSDGLTDRNGKPIGTDFSSFYAAGSLALNGHAADVYNGALHYARQQQIFGAATPYYAWFYPPLFLLIAAPLALLAYLPALAIWQFGTIALYLAVLGAILRDTRATISGVRRNWMIVALAFPAVLINLGHGQNGFLSAAIFGAALIALPKRPIVAGVLFAVLAYKPQFGIAIPIALLASGQWRAIVAAGITLAMLVLTTVLMFGTDAWSAFLATTDVSRKLLLEQGTVGFEKLQSIFAAVRLWGGGVPIAYIVQAIVSLTVVATVAWIWRTKLDDARKASLLVVGTLLASPHILDYDLVILAIAIAFTVKTGASNGFRPYEITLLGGIWIVPLLARSIAGAAELPLGFLTMAAFYGIMFAGAVRDLAGLTTRYRAFAQA